jgi:uncharacterized protein YjbI with pentapeptide repeats
MTPRRPGSPIAIGATQPPDVEELERIVLDGLEPQLELEGVWLESTSLGGADAGSVRFERAHLQDVDLVGSKLRALRLLDVAGERIDAANGDWGGAELRRVRLQEARLTGLDLGEARLEEVSFSGCKLDYVNLRYSVLRHVTFEDCVLNGADFQAASIEATRFHKCELREADFSKAELSHVDLRGSELALAGSVLGLRGAIVDSLQLMELAGALAHELGIAVEDD